MPPPRNPLWLASIPHQHQNQPIQILSPHPPGQQDQENNMTNSPPQISISIFPPNPILQVVHRRLEPTNQILGILEPMVLPSSHMVQKKIDVEVVTLVLCPVPGQREELVEFIAEFEVVGKRWGGTRLWDFQISIL